MTVAAEAGPSSVENYGSASQLRKDLSITGLAGPSQGSANALQQQQTQQQPRGGKHAGMTAVHHPRGITVTPPEVFFEDVRAGLLFVLTFSVQNTCTEMRRISVTPPRTPVFSLNYEPVGGLAPGLDLRAEVEFQLPDEDEVDDLGSPFAPGEVREYADKFVITSGEDKVEVPLLARRPTPAVVHNRTVEFGTVSNEKKAFGTVSLVNKGSRKASFSVTWDKTLPIVFNPSEGILEEGRGYRDAQSSIPTPSEGSSCNSVAQLEVTFDATKWSTAEPFRALATLVVPGQHDSVIDMSASVCPQKLRLLDGDSGAALESTVAEFGTLHYGCRAEIKYVIFNDGPEAAPFMVSVDSDGVRGGQGQGGTGGGDEQGRSKNDAKEQLPFGADPLDGTIPPYGRQNVSIRFLPSLSPRLSGFKGEGHDQEPLPSAFKGKILFENAEKRGDTVSLSVAGKGVQPTVKVTQRVVRFGACPCYERRDVVVGINNTGELPVRFNISKAPNFTSTPSKGLLQPMQSQNTVLTFCPTQLGHFRSVLKISLGGDTLVIPIRVVGEASTVGAKQPRPGGIDMLPADFKPKFNFVLSESASAIRRAAEGKEAWLRPKPFETVDLLATNSWDSTTHTVGSVGGVDAAFRKLTFSMQDLALREQSRRDSDAWLTVQRLKRANTAAEKAAVRRAKAQGKDWRDPENGVEMGMGRWMESEEPVPRLPHAQDEPLFLHVPLDGQGQGGGASDVKADINKLITRKFKQRPATQAETRDCAAPIGRGELAKIDLHFRTLDFGQVTIGSANVRNFAVTNNLPHAVLAELVGVEGQSELEGTGPPAQVVPAGVTAGFDVHFKCHTEQVYRKALKMSINSGAVLQFSLLAHTVPVSVELDRDEVEMKFPEGSLESILRHPLTLTNGGNSTAAFAWTTRGAFTVSPEKGTIGPRGKQDAEIIWTPQPGCKASESLVLKVEGGQDKVLEVSGKLHEARCRFAPPGKRGNNTTPTTTTANATASSPPPLGEKGTSTMSTAGGVLDFGRASVGVEIVRMVTLQNVGKSPAVFCVDAPELKQIGMDVHPVRGLVQPKQSCTLAVVLRATKELRLDGVTLSANIRGGKPAKISLMGDARIPEVSLAENVFDLGSLAAGGCESLKVNLQNRGPIPASLQLDLSQYPDFHLERAKTRAQPGGVAAGTGEDSRQGGRNERESSWVVDIDPVDGDSSATLPSVASSPGGHDYKAPTRQWKMLVAPGDTLCFKLVFRPLRPGEHSFQLPLSLEGIPPDGSKHLRVPVSAAGLRPTLTFTSTEVDFGRRVVSRDPCGLNQYQGEFLLRNASDKGLCWVLDDAFLKGPGARAEGIADEEVGCPPDSPDASLASDPVTPALYVSPTSGQLSPGEESRIRLTFTPKRAGALSFALPVWLARVPAKETRPYLTLLVKGFGVYPCLTFTKSPVELPVVPLSVTSRAVFMVENNGFSDMEVSYRLPPHCPVDVAVTFPEGRQLGAGVERIPVELSFRSLKPVSFSCVMDVFDADGGHYPLPIRGCADNCLLTNFPFVQAYRHRFKFWAKDGKAVMFMNEAQIKAQEAKDFKDRQAKRAKAKAKNKSSAAAKLQQQQQQQQPDASVSAAQGQSTASLTASKLEHTQASADGGVGGGGTATAGVAGGGDVADAGIDLSEEAFAAGVDEAGARVLRAWLNANVATSFIEEFPASIVEAHGRPALEAIETMCGRRVPGQTWRKLAPAVGSGGAGGGAADIRVTALMDQYRQMLRFLGEKGCLLNSVRPEELLDRADCARERASSGGKGAGAGAGGGGGGRGRGGVQTSLAPPVAGSRMEGSDELSDERWARRSREAWSTVMYQCIRTFMLARVTPRALAALPGVFIVLPTKKAGGKGEGSKAETDPELTGSNVLSVGEGVLLKWLFYHLEQANRTCMVKRVATFSDDLADCAILCQAVASHAPHLAVKGAALHGFIPVHSTGELSDLSNREQNASKLLTAMGTLKMDFGITTEDVLKISDRDGVLLALHLFQALPQMVPKMEVEFRANLGSIVSKSIELKNPSAKAITYDVTLEGSSDFRAKTTLVNLEPGKEAEFAVELLPRFSSPVEARLTFWAARTKGGMAPASNMVFTLKSKVDSVKAISVSTAEGACYESKTISLEISNPFEASAKDTPNSRFTVRLKQAMISEHPAVANLAPPGGGRRASLAARRRASSVLLSSVPSTTIASKTSAATGDGGVASREAAGGKKGRDGGGAKASVGDDNAKVRAEVEAAMKLPFHTDQDSVTITAGGTATLSLLLLPFTPGEYKCTIMFWNERLGEFAQEVKASVGMPLTSAELSLKVTARDSGGGGEAVQRELLLPSKNLALQNALLGVLLERFQSDRKTRARQAMISICADVTPDNVATGATANATAAAKPEGASRDLYALEADSPFFQLSRDTVFLASEALGASSTGGGSSGGNGGGITARNTARGAGPTNTNNTNTNTNTTALVSPGGAGGAGGGGSNNNKRRDLPKKAELLPLSGGDCTSGGDATTIAAAAAGVGAMGGGGGGGSPLLETNSILLNFFPRAAGTYPCRLQVKRRMKHLVDVRCIDIAAVVEAPRNATALVFRAPAGQTITQEIPIHNNGDVGWVLNAGPRQPPFGGPNQLTVPAHGMASYPLTFSPARATGEDIVSKLVLADMKDKAKPAKFEFDLRGTAEEPLAEGHRIVRCSARERVEQVFSLKNPTAKALEYIVDSDLPGVTGSPGVTVPGRGQADYRLSMCPQFGGVFTGSLTFTAPGGVVTWYTVEVQASNPLEEDKVSICTILRQAVSVEISLSNPLDDELQFQVSLQGEGLLGDPTFSLGPLASSTYTLYYSPLRVQSHQGSVTFSADAVGQFWYRLDLRADPCPPVRLNEISCPAGASRGVTVSIDNPVGRDIVLCSKTSNNRNFSVEPPQIAIGPYGTTSFQVLYTPSSLGQTETGDVVLAHPELGDWVFEASGTGEMPGVMDEHRTVATVGSTASAMFPFRNPFPEPLLLTVMLKLSGEETGQVEEAKRDSLSARGVKSWTREPDDDDESSKGRGSAGGGSHGSQGWGAKGEGAGRVPFSLLLKKTSDLVLQPFQVLQIPLSFSPEVIVEEKACVEVRGQLGGRSLTWVFPIVGGGEAPGELRVFSISCPAKSSTREDFEVELVGLAGVQGEEEFEFEVVLPEDAKLKRMLGRALTVAPVISTLSHPQEKLKFQVSLEPLKPFRTSVEVIVKRKTGGGRWRYEVRVDSTDPPPDDSISLKAPVGGVSSAVFRLCNRYLAYAPFQAYFTVDSALSLSVEPTDGVLTPFGTDGTPVTVTYSPTRYAPNQKGLLIVETEDIRWSYAVTGDFPVFRPPTGVSSKVDSGSHSGSRTKLRSGVGSSTRGIRSRGGESTGGRSWKVEDVGVGGVPGGFAGGAFTDGRGVGSRSPSSVGVRSAGGGSAGGDARWK